MMNLIPALAILLALWGCRPVRPLTALDRDSLSPERCLSLRGIVAMVPILHHLAQNTESGALLHFYLYFGPPHMSVFFFLSGYGLMRSMMKKSGYGRGFILRHVPPLAALLLAVLCLFSLLHAAMSDPIGVPELFMRIFSDDLIMVIYWYMLVLILFYVAFGLLARLFPGQPKKVLVGMVLFCLAYQGICFARLVGQWWYFNCQLMPIGMAWALYEEKIDAFLERFWLPAVLFCAVGYACLYQFFDAIFALAPGYAMRFAILAASNVLFCGVVILMMKKLYIGNGVLRFLGSVSLELYLLQGPMLLLFHSPLIWIENEFVYALAVIASTVALSALVHPLYTAAVRRYRKKIA
ncbi:MAG: acyltransferase [Oscillospiraceae bacterium]|nr:acyltransferase [Oscillospiraceae bacterium]